MKRQCTGTGGQGNTRSLTPVRARSYVFTLNNYKDEDIEHLKAADCKYLVFGKEVGEQGTNHLQGTIQYKNAKVFSTVKKDVGERAHIEICKSLLDSVKYCKKDGDWFEKGQVPTDGGVNEKERWELALKEAQETGVCSDAQIQFKYRNVIKKHHEDHILSRELQPLQNLDNVWIWGASGVGKSKLARTFGEESNTGSSATASPADADSGVVPQARLSPRWQSFAEGGGGSLYDKRLNKWWDGYTDEPTVLLDDFDKRHDYLIHYLKRWADHYPFPAEIKGGSKVIRPKRIIVTSNWNPEDIWKDENDLEPIRRRFKFIHMI